MASYFKLHAYDADVWLPEFKGLHQEDESMIPDPRYASECLNVETPHGVLQPHAGFDNLNGEFAQPVGTLARFYRRWYTGTGSKHWLVSASGGKLYYMQEGMERLGWTEIYRPSTAGLFQSDTWSWVTYEVNIQGHDHPIDVLIMSNAQDGMILVTPPERPSIWYDYEEYTWADIAEMTWGEVYSEKWTVARVTTGGKNFGIIERYADRIWGGAIPGDPDMLMYSAPYDPTDWSVNTEIPEDGAGSIQQPSWDGDSFTALRKFGDQLIAFKEHRVWRVLGTDPGTFEFKEQYGGGAPFFNTVCVDVERIFMADVNGLSTYDGMSVTPFQRDLIAPLWRKINKSAMDQMCAALYDNRYYLAVPIGDSTVNNALVVLNLHDATILYYEDVNVESMLATTDAIYATSSTAPGKVILMHYDSWVAGKATGGATKWISSWIDLGYKTIQKGGFDLYITPEVQNEAVTLKISIQTEKKTKTKEYTVQPLTEAQKAVDKQHRNKKLHFGGSGRRFRIMIETAEGVTAPWRLVGGLHLVVETDPD